MSTARIFPKASQVDGTHTDEVLAIVPSEITEIGTLTLAEAQSLRIYSNSGLTTEVARWVVHADLIYILASSVSSSMEYWADWDGSRSDYAAGDTYGRNAVFANYNGWYELNEADTVLTIVDATGNGDATLDKTDGGITQKVAGLLGDCIELSGADTAGKLELPTGQIVHTDDFTLQIFYEPDVVDSTRRNCFTMRDDVKANFAFNRNAAGTMSMWDGANWVDISGTNAYVANQWQQFSWVYDQTVGETEAFVDGVTKGTHLASLITGDLVLGYNPMFANDMPDGKVAHIRIIRQKKSADLLATESRNMLDNAAFWDSEALSGSTSPTVTTQAASSIDNTIATLNGNVTALGDETTVDTAFDYRVVGAGSWTRTTPDTGVTATGAYTKGITGLTAAEDYEYRSVVIYNTTEEVYGSEVTFTTAAAPTAPTVTTQAVTSITETTATGNGNVTDDGGETITERGVAVSTSATPTTGDTTFTSAGTTGAFTASMTGLTGSTLYYVRAYAINSEGTSYGSEVTFTTAAAPTAPTVTTQAVTDVATTTATGNGNVTTDGGETVTERGVCWSTTTAPTTADSTATSAGTTGAFTSTITGLTAETLYYVRAYAINSEGTSYGSEVTFTTTEVTVPKYAAYTKIAGELVRIS